MQVRRLKFARMTPKFFPNAATFRRWLGTHHARAAELVVGFYKRDSGRARRSGRYSYEQRPTRLPEPHARLLRADAAALRFFMAQIPSYRRAATWWVISAQRPQTRARRAALLVELSAAGRLIPQFLRGTRPSRSGARGRPRP
jgi:uncharacterized protein YdeI (YjbR/CyaY-like superfamily)